MSFLHVYHHTITALFSWCYLKLLPGEQGIVIGILNSIVHIVMYSYYLIAALGPKYQKYIWWKKYMTWIQLVIFQFSSIVYNNFFFLFCLNNVLRTIFFNFTKFFHFTNFSIPLFIW